jgi:hypothetical protein
MERSIVLSAITTGNGFNCKIKTFRTKLLNLMTDILFDQYLFYHRIIGGIES